MDWKDACKKSQEKGLKFELYCAGSWVFNTWDFTAKIEDYRIAAQPTPNLADWRESCRKLHGCGVAFDFLFQSEDWMVVHITDFGFDRTSYRIPAQPIPAGIEKYLEKEMAEQKQDNPEIPHLEQQIQWHEDMLHHLRTGEPMREWEYKEEYSEGVWLSLNEYGCYPEWHKENEYRRKPRTVTYWHCVGECTDRGGKEDTVYLMSGDLEDLEKEVLRHRKMYTTAKFSAIIETTVKMED